MYLYNTKGAFLNEVEPVTTQTMSCTYTIQKVHAFLYKYMTLFALFQVQLRSGKHAPFVLYKYMTLFALFQVQLRSRKQAPFVLYKYMTLFALLQVQLRSGKAPFVLYKYMTLFALFQVQLRSRKHAPFVLYKYMTLFAGKHLLYCISDIVCVVPGSTSFKKACTFCIV